jgi:hypothetical protein
MYPSSFEIDRVDVNLASSLSPKSFPDSTRPDETSPWEGVRPFGVSWRASATRKRDWMTSVPHFSEVGDPDSGHARAPLAPLVDQLAEASHPIAFQALFRQKADWSHEPILAFTECPSSLPRLV